MVIVTLQQHFPLGRFHANPWKAFPFDDPYGEWPPSPWRLIRAIVARSHQLACEEPGIAENDRAKLVRAFCSSSIRWYLPAESWRGPGLRQYQPAEFSRVPKSATEPGYMAHATTKNQDNCGLSEGMRLYGGLSPIRSGFAVSSRFAKTLASTCNSRSLNVILPPVKSFCLRKNSLQRSSERKIRFCLFASGRQSSEVNAKSRQSACLTSTSTRLVSWCEVSLTFGSRAVR